MILTTLCGFVLVTLSGLAGRHPLAPCPVSGLPIALSSLVFEMTLGLAHRARGFAGFFCCSQRNAIGITRHVAVGDVIFFALVGSINSLHAYAEACQSERG